MSSKTIFFKLIFPKFSPNFPNDPEIEIHSRHDGIYESLTPKITEADFDHYIDDLKSELENIRREGKKKFAEWKNYQK